MKILLVASAILLSTVSYSQDNLIAADDSVKSEKELRYRLNEIEVSNRDSEIVLGELDIKSKKGMAIAADGKIACYFKNTVGDDVLIKSMLFKVQKVKYRTEAHIRLYKKHDYMQDLYSQDGATVSYASFIPGEQIVTEEIVVFIEPGQKGVVEVDLTKYAIEMPAEGLFVSMEGTGYFDAEGRELKGLDPKEMTWVDFHPTATDNYCEWSATQGTQSRFWSNINKRIKKDFEIVFKKEPSKKILRAPNFGLKVARK